MKFIQLLKLVKSKPKIKGSITNKILESERDKFFHQLIENFPKLKFWESSKQEIEIYADRFMQIHSLRCRNCLKDKACKKMELLINLEEIF